MGPAETGEGGMLSGLKVRLGLLFLAFFLLLSMSMAATLWTIETQQQDVRVLNLAGRQRMLVQQMTREALRIGVYGDESSLEPLVEAAYAFDRTLSALAVGGTTPYPPGQMVSIPATRDRETLAALERVGGGWSVFRRYVDEIATTPRPNPGIEASVLAIEELAPGLLEQADEVVRHYEAAAARKMSRLRRIQLISFGGGLALLAAGLLLVQGSVVRPLRRLGAAAKRIGHADLVTPVETEGPREIASLAESIDAMRDALAASHQAQEAWREEQEARVTQRTRELAALQEVSRELTSQLALPEVLRSITDKAQALLAADVAVLCLLESDHQILHLRASSAPPGAVRGGRTSALRQPADRVLAAEQAQPCDAGECQGCCGIVSRPFLNSHLVAPLRIGRRVIGALCVGGASPGQFSDQDGHLLTELANSAAIAVENARLYEQAERVAALEERQRIAAEMHDGLAQMVSYLGLQVDQAADLYAAGHAGAVTTHLQGLRGTIEQASAEVRRALTRLQQDPQPPQALHERLASLVADAWVEGQPQVDLVLATRESLVLPYDACEEVLRVAGEALLNAQRHSGAKRIGVRLEHPDGRATMIVEDDGRGFDLALLPEGNQHFGLSIMRARAARLGGRLEVESMPGRGTRVTLTWPLTGQAEGGKDDGTHSRTPR